MITVYGRKTSSNVQTVMWAIGEMGIAHERIDIGGAFGGNNDPDYLEMNPNGLVPTVRDGDVTLFESNAITRYLVAKYGGESGIRQSDPAAHAIADMWMEWAKTTVYPNVIAGLFMALVRTPASERDQARIAELEQKTKTVMGIAESQLSKHKFLASDQLSIADFGFGTLLYRYFDMEIARGEFPALKAYYQRLSERVAYRNHAMIDYSSLRAN